VFSKERLAKPLQGRKDPLVNLTFSPESGTPRSGNPRGVEFCAWLSIKLEFRRECTEADFDCGDIVLKCQPNSSLIKIDVVELVTVRQFLCGH